ncbi:hypothetical protein ABB37_05591 [Leptomonas pyrrhocoris]|uniref:Uncharacterized protein n=1 Tax=Leptomonas pyrrhocoris TaxID=157538 RepID=A0A0N0VEQ5_LEPPY|nr:hypothetical protein ABB37_05591 [Leptomonas pyrrhocoris]KPA79058.1 hypothetical protein ABB37_05591 [Leptomonas pyrrhocoris]|eukprot:XP_015657497.1 hypothetical protein ABB37_05591 [Leptomonas pyrrhocoris]
MEQAQEQRTRQSSAAADAKSCLADEEAFNSVRQAALVLFKQRTKDLTRLASVEAQSQKIEAELQQAQTSVAQLSAQQAALDAQVEDEQQRVRQREGRLAELHGALVQLDEEQRTFKKLQQAAEAAIGAATTFIVRFTSADGRLFQLLALAKERVGGRNARELQIVATQIQQKLTDAVEQKQRLLSGPCCLPSGALASPFAVVADVPPSSAVTGSQQDAVKAFGAVMQGWMTQAEPWSRHRELTGVVAALRCLLQWVTEDTEADPEETFAVGEAGANQTASVWPPLPQCPAVALAEDVFLHLPEVELEKVMEEQVHAPVKALRAFFDQLTATCVRDRICLPPEVAAVFTALETTVVEGWTSLVAQRHQWAEKVEDAASATELAAAAAQSLLRARTELQAQSESCEQLRNALAQRLSEVETGKELQLGNYAAAWQKGWRTLSAQRASLLAAQRAVDARVTEAAHNDALLKSEAEAHAAAVEVSKRAVQEQQRKLSAAQALLDEASTQKAALEEELAAAQQTEREAQRQLEALLSHPQKPAAEGEMQSAVLSENCTAPDTLLGVTERVRPSAAAALQSVPACPDVYKIWASDVEAQKQHLADDDVLAALFMAAPCGDPTELSGNMTDGATRQSVRRACTAALQHVATAVLRLPAELLMPDVLDDDLLSRLSCLTALAAEEESMRTSAAAHRTFVAEAQAEMRLLRQELTAGV